VIRQKVVGILKDLSNTHHSFALAQMASMASSDHFVEIHGLIGGMIEKLLKEAQEDATHEAACKKSKEKSTTLDKLQTRSDGATIRITELTEGIKRLESEIAEIDKSQAQATEIRTKENEDYLKASKDFKGSAEAVVRAIEVLRNYYEGAFIQAKSAKMRSNISNISQPDFGSAKNDTAHTIISVLEMSEQDFKTLLTESVQAETEAAKAYEKLTNENKVSKATRETEAQGKALEVNSLKVKLQDHGTVPKEREGVTAYMDEPKLECEPKAMPYEERKAAREAEIARLREALKML